MALCGRVSEIRLRCGGGADVYTEAERFERTREVWFGEGRKRQTGTRVVIIGVSNSNFDEANIGPSLASLK